MSRRTGLAATASVALAASAMAAGAHASSHAIRASAAPIRPMLYWSDPTNPPQLRGHVHTSPGARVTLSFYVTPNRVVTHTHRYVRRGTAGPKGRYYFRLRFKFTVSQPMFVNVTAVAREPDTRQTSISSFPLALFPPTD